MLVVVGQFVVIFVWEKNVEICVLLMVQVVENDVLLFVLLEVLLVCDDYDVDLLVKLVQLLEGEFFGFYGEKVNVI